MSARQQQVGGDHYRTMEIQPWDAMQAWMSATEFRGFLRGNAIKYLARCDRKGAPLDDLRKARHYIDRLIELELQEPAFMAQVQAREAVRRATDRNPWEVPRA